ncbi:hypothetical protein BH11MYX1_BH11MYX1_47950 [soil metagenome]
MIERASGIDLASLASDVGAVPMQVGAILRFVPGARLNVIEVRAAMAERIVGTPRMRQRLVSTPLGCGRPLWVDDAEFDILHHVLHVRCPAPGDQAALLRVAAAALTHRLRSDRPLWSATLVTGLAAETCALIVVFHHVLIRSEDCRADEIMKVDVGRWVGP